MEIRVSGHQMETGAALQEHAAERLNGIVEKYFSRAISSQVTFGKAPASAFACDIVMHVNNGLVLKSHGHEQANHAAQQEEAAYTVFAPEKPEAEEVAEAPPVIAETRIDIPEVSVSDAVMMLDLRHTNALFFKNAGTGRHNMVYRRDDGSIGWVEPS